MPESEPIAVLTERFAGVTTSEFRGDTRVVVPGENLHDALRLLRDEQGFDLLVDITCVDYLNYREAPDRFGLVYLLTSTENSQRLTVRSYVGDVRPLVPTVTDIWPGADWLEREVWDMFGITFDGHPDHRRILMPDEFTGHPLRKDYPLQGRGERHNFPVLTRSEA